MEIFPQLLDELDDALLACQAWWLGFAATPLGISSHVVAGIGAVLAAGGI